MAALDAPPRSSAFLDRLARSVILGDGAMGTMLEAGVRAAGPAAPTYLVPEQLNALAPEQVLAVHRAYAAAGAEALETNSFGGNAVKLRAAGIDWAQGRALVVRAAQLARQAADESARSNDRSVWVAGSIGPTGDFLEPLGDLTFEEARRVFADQAAALAEGGADLLLVETMTDLQEARAALRGALSTGLPALVTLTFEPHGRTMMGLSAEDAIRALAEDGAAAVGVNCGQGPASVLPIVLALHAARPDLPLIAQPNAGQPRLDGGEVRYDVGPEAFATGAAALVAAGVRLLGACCGSTPAYTAALAEALRPRPPR